MDAEIRTDLALEEKERYEGTDVEVKGVSLEETMSPAGLFPVTMVKILNEEGERNMRKPTGNYITLENCRIDSYDEVLYEDMAEEIARQLLFVIGELEKKKKIRKKKVIVAGLGNREATPDALGPVVAEHIEVGKCICAVAPGVMAQTGCETSRYVRGIAKELDAGFIIAVDSLAARNTGRLNTTIQITDTGINPGSGVGNHRQAMNEETMGVPVIAIGVPTVVDAATIVNDVMDNLMAAFENAGMIRGLSDTMEEFSEKEKKQLVKELMDQKARDLYVTPKDIDEDIRILGEIIAQGINEAMDRYHAVA